MHGKSSFPSTRHRQRPTGTAERGVGDCSWFAPALTCLLAVAAPASARDAPTWNLDPVHTRVMFAVSHAGFSQALGTVSGSTGTLVFDPDDWQRTRLQASVPLARADLGDPDWNRAVLAPRLLDVEAYPAASFTSDSAVASDSGGIRVCGELSLHGVTRPLCMDVTVNAVKRHPMPPFRRTAGFSATAVLSRSDFGITAWPSVIGDEVTIRIEAEAVRSRAAGRPPEPEPPSETEPQLTPEPEPESEPVSGALQ
ncbi:polyisoprenoid-binding protein [Lysobacter sp. H21R4]|uniref:YceI family protein n=1 Tax=Lysobacter sp. H21R4 TaxID=2781021 RepID=UPI001886FFA4|nr:YceI family protein [Lysobacter sp. H21R4]QOY62241.1 polyisoprenoid-binding protein [Lysobacter sp. H21R4]